MSYNKKKINYSKYSLKFTGAVRTYVKVKPSLKDEIRRDIINNLNIRIGSDINNLVNAYEIENELLIKRTHLENSVSTKLFFLIYFL